MRYHRQSLIPWLGLVLIAAVLAGCGGTPAATTVPEPPAAPEPTAVPEPVQEPTKAPEPTAVPEPVQEPTTEPEPAAADISADDVVRMPMDELKTLIDEGAEVIILDNRPGPDYRNGHIKGAISLPWGIELDPAAVADLSKDAAVVTYCDCGPGEADSADMAAKLIRMGFKDVKTLAPGWYEWFEAGYPTE